MLCRRPYNPIPPRARYILIYFYADKKNIRYQGPRMISTAPTFAFAFAFAFARGT